MRVLHIGKYFAPFKGGVETYLRDLITSLQRRGVDCAALVHRHDGRWGSTTETFSAADSGCTVVRAGVWLTAFFTPISPFFRSELRRLIRRFEPDVIHVHLPNPSACWVLWLAEARSLPLVVHWHSDVITGSHGPLMKLLYALYRPLERRLLAQAAAIVATSESYLESSASLQGWPDKCHVVPLGLDPARIDSDVQEEPVPRAGDGDFQVLAIGRLTYYKGFGFLIRAAAQLEGIQVHIVGVGEQWRELRKLAAHLRVGSKVVFHGATTDAELARRFQACDCLCLPSVERTEAFGMVLLEAMYFGKPTVISKVPGSGMAWVVDAEVTGIQVPPKRVDRLAEALARLRDDPRLCRRLGEAGRRRFDAQFAIGHSADSLEALYQGLAGEAASRGAGNDG